MVKKIFRAIGAIFAFLRFDLFISVIERIANQIYSGYKVYNIPGTNSKVTFCRPVTLRGQTYLRFGDNVTIGRGG